MGDHRNSEQPAAPPNDEPPDEPELDPEPEAHQEPEPDPEDDFHDDAAEEHEEHEDDVPRRSGETRRRRLEKLVPDLLKRAIERGIEAGLNSLGNASKARERSEGTIPPPAPSSAGSSGAPHPASAARESVREAQRELASVPKEIAGYVFSQIDDTKNATVRVVAREVREFLEAADLATELQKALTKLSFEIRTEIRFIPNDSGGIKPEVKAAVTPRRDKRQPGRRPTALASEDHDPDE